MDLQNFASSVGAGQFDKELPVRSRDELGQMAAALNKMAADLRESSAEREVAERASQIKSLFLANMSHEIRTPVNAILGFADLLKEDNLSESKRQRYLEIIDRTGNGLATIINDILDIAKVEAGKLEISRSTCFLPQILKDVESLLRLRTDEKGITLRMVAEKLPEQIITDATRFKQILLNIAGNAIKFTDHGTVTLKFAVSGRYLSCTIKDTGVGIPMNKVEKLFQPFSQVDLSIRKQFGGTGLGLVLSRRLARLLGGDVMLLHSEPGVGSTFLVSIGLELPAFISTEVRKRYMACADPKTLDGMSILVVEDSMDNQLLAQEYLMREGAKVHMVHNGQEAIEAMTNQSFDLVLMDMQMPVMDGYTATSRLRRMGFRTPIIALTAHAMKEDLDKCLNAGCDDYLCKPFRRAGLIELILQHREPAAQAA